MPKFPCDLLTCCCQLHAVPHHPRRLQLPGSAAGKPHPRPGLLHSVRLLRLLHSTQHVPGYHQRHLLGSQGRHFHAEKRIRDVRLPETGTICTNCFRVFANLEFVSDYYFVILTGILPRRCFVLV